MAHKQILSIGIQIICLFDNRNCLRYPFNIEDAEYTLNEQEEVEKKLPGLLDVFHNHTGIRELSPDMKNGFMGISWWKLKDVTDKFDDFFLPEL